MLKGGERDFRGGLCGGLLVPLRSRETRSVRRTEAGCVGLAGRAKQKDPVGKDIWDEASKVRSEGPLATGGWVTTGRQPRGGEVGFDSLPAPLRGVGPLMSTPAA